MSRKEPASGASRFELVVFDLDDTLCDYAGAKKRALAEAVALLGVADDAAERVISRFVEKEPALFRSMAAGEIGREAYRRERFRQALLAPVPDERIEAANSAYMAGANRGVRLYPEALPVLQALAARNLHLAIPTNGPSDGQRDKLAATGLDRIVPNVFISEEKGIAKPERGAFLGVLTAFGVAPQMALMVGDDLKNDIEPARRLGMTALHLVRGGGTGGGRIGSLEAVIDHVLAGAARG